MSQRHATSGSGRNAVGSVSSNSATEPGHHHSRSPERQLFPNPLSETAQIGGNRRHGTKSSWCFSAIWPGPIRDQQLHLIMDLRHPQNPTVQAAWLAANPRIHMQNSPHIGVVLNLVEVWFCIIERQAIHRGTFTSVPRPDDQGPGLHHRLERPPPTPFTWTKTADQILTRANRRTASDSVH